MNTFASYSSVIGGSNLSPRIIGGSVANITKYPYAAFLAVFYPEDEENGKEDVSECTGVIIGEEWILTAAHCFKYCRRVIHSLKCKMKNIDFK